MTSFLRMIFMETNGNSDDYTALRKNSVYRKDLVVYIARMTTKI